jgi:CRP-like cAMP-binding protein
LLTDTSLVLSNFAHLDELVYGGYDCIRCGEFFPIAESNPNMARKSELDFSAAIFRKKFGAGLTVRSYRDKDVIFSQGDAADALFYVHSGTVKLTVVSTRKKAILAFLQRGSFFGEGCLGGQPLRIYTARSVGHSNITRLAKGNAMRAFKRDPKFANLFVEYLLSRIIRIEEDLVDQFFNFSERRLARVLLLLGHVIEESKLDSPLRVSQGTLAEMVGTTRARVSKFMKAFKKKGFVNYNGSLQINSEMITAYLLRRPMSVITKG